MPHSGRIGIKAGKDFFLGYSPERINPGDDKNTFLETVGKGGLLLRMIKPVNRIETNL